MLIDWDSLEIVKSSKSPSHKHHKHHKCDLHIETIEEKRFVEGTKRRHQRGVGDNVLVVHTNHVML